MNRWNKLLLLFVITALLIVGCGRNRTTGSSNTDDPWGVLVINPGKKISIGVALSSIDAAEGLEMARGIELAIQQHQDVAGFSFETVKTDTECSASGGEAAATELISDTKIAAVIGPDCSSACQGAVPIFDEAHYTAISPGCGASDLSDSVLHHGAFLRTIPPDTAEGYLAAQYAYEVLGARRVAVIDDGSLDTTDVAAAFTTQFASMGGRIGTHVTILPEEPDILSALERINAADIELIYAPLMAAEAANFVIRKRDFSNLAYIPVLGGRHYWGDWFIESAQDKAGGVYTIGPHFTSAAYKEATTAYKNRYGEAPPSAVYAYAYDATSILIAALDKVASVDRQGNLLIGRRVLQEAIYDIAGYPGLTGELTCTTWGNCGAASLAVSQVQMSKWVVVYIP
ncbi:MAG: branched-chain amino acid ABC transporter substrate-binding protein [Anaerolineae bacterium]|nr:branched-chain amino acid ABC transporter substrate-binding protein [Anaerolineae bacterium]